MQTNDTLNNSCDVTLLMRKNNKATWLHAVLKNEYEKATVTLRNMKLPCFKRIYFTNILIKVCYSGFYYFAAFHCSNKPWRRQTFDMHRNSYTDIIRVTAFTHCSCSTTENNLQQVDRKCKVNITLVENKWHQPDKTCYDTRCYFTCIQKPTEVSLMYRTEQAKSGKKKN